MATRDWYGICCVVIICLFSFGVLAGVPYALGNSEREDYVISILPDQGYEPLNPVEPIPSVEYAWSSSNFEPAQESSRRITEYKPYQFNNRELQRFAVEVPEVSLQYMGQVYTIGGCVDVVGRWEDFRRKNGDLDVAAWGDYDRSFLQYGYQFKLNNLKKADFSQSLENPDIPETVLHEVAHFMVDQKYPWLNDQANPFLQEDASFIHEMIAFLSEGKTEEEALLLIEKEYGYHNAIAKYKASKASQGDVCRAEGEHQNEKWICPGCNKCDEAIIKGWLGNDYECISPEDSEDGHYQAIPKAEK